jgi:CheY-like chemotaxis protein
MRVGELRILFIEDEPDQVRGTQMRLQRVGCITTISRTLEDAIHRLHREEFDILIVDGRLPAVSDGPMDLDGGLQLIRDLRSGRYGELNRNKPFFMLTAQFRSVDTGIVRAFEQLGNCLGVENKLRQYNVVKTILLIREQQAVRDTGPSSL